ncbi:hypothetical protein MRX96_006505 [Rhipicephalus microplus]
MAAESDGAATKTAERTSPNDGPSKTTHPSTPVSLERHEQLGRGDKRRLAQGSEEQYLQKCERPLENQTTLFSCSQIVCGFTIRGLLLGDQRDLFSY